jgi:hypothetical protein
VEVRTPVPNPPRRAVSRGCGEERVTYRARRLDLRVEFPSIEVLLVRLFSSLEPSDDAIFKVEFLSRPTDQVAIT